MPPRMPGIAGPRILLRRNHHASPNRVQLNIAVAHQQIIVRINQTGFVSAFPKRTGPTIGVIDMPDIQPAHMLHDPGNAFRILRRHQQMNMSGHQHIGVQRHPIPLKGIP